LRAAKDAGLHVYVACAPTYPECDEDDLRKTLTAVRDLDPITVFHEPINIRAENVERIEKTALALGVKLDTSVFSTRDAWQDYAVRSLTTVSRIAAELGLSDRLHLWPDKSLGSKARVAHMSDPVEFERWLHRCWHRISEWPTTAKGDAQTH